jgi:hypothetical protein
VHAGGWEMNSVGIFLFIVSHSNCLGSGQH